MLIQQAGGPRAPARLASGGLVAELEPVESVYVGFERKARSASVRAPLAGRKSRAAAFSPAYRRTASAC